KNILEFFMFCIILEFFMLCIFSFKFFIFPRPRKNCGLGKTEYGREHRRDKCSAKISISLWSLLPHFFGQFSGKFGNILRKRTWIAVAAVYLKIYHSVVTGKF